MTPCTHQLRLPRALPLPLPLAPDPDLARAFDLALARDLDLRWPVGEWLREVVNES